LPGGDGLRKRPIVQGPVHPHRVEDRQELVAQDGDGLEPEAALDQRDRLGRHVLVAQKRLVAPQAREDVTRRCVRLVGGADERVEGGTSPRATTADATHLTRYVEP
jgi:hypothetical protein